MGHSNLNSFSKNKNLHFQDADYLPGTILNVLYIILTTTLCDRYCHYPHFNQWQRIMTQWLNKYTHRVNYELCLNSLSNLWESLASMGKESPFVLRLSICFTSLILIAAVVFKDWDCLKIKIPLLPYHFVLIQKYPQEQTSEELLQLV